MSTTTANFGWPKPGLGDLPDGPTQIAALADAMDADLGVYCSDTGWVTTGFSALNSATIVYIAARRIGLQIALYASIQLGASITVPSNGDLASSVQLAQIPPLFTPSFGHNQGIGSGATGPICQWVVDNTGKLSLASTTSGASLPSGTTITASGIYFR